MGLWKKVVGKAQDIVLGKADESVQEAEEITKKAAEKRKEGGK